MTDRLDVFLPSQRRRYADVVPVADPSTWPPLEGFLAVLCASRSGSTVLCREIERRFRFRRVDESLRLPRLAKVAADHGLGSVNDSIAATIRADSEAGWFAFKAGAEALLVGELSGLIPARLDKMRLILLLRRDLVAQAVSIAKAEQTGIWHSNQVGKRVAGDAVYDAARIAGSLRRILAALEALRLYARIATVPAARLFYEDFADGDTAPIEAACDDLGLPRRVEPWAPAWRTVTKIGDGVNLEWADRFRGAMDGDTREMVAGYAAFCAADFGTWDRPIAPAAAGAA